MQLFSLDTKVGYHNGPLLYQGYAIGFQEVPKEISLIINIAGCPWRCEGCHSQHLWENKGDILLDDLPGLIEKYNGLITCVCFMGGDWNLCELWKACSYVKSKSLKTCIYTAISSLEELEIRGYKQRSPDITYVLDYLKTGRYIEKLGGLSSPTTNQVLWDLTDGIPIKVEMTKPPFAMSS